MDNIGTEIGQKMRSAVKAKLIELGTGSATGYIDDELPDYIMIMVANKRTKAQMIDDLNLFLGSHTETFVNWLHQVLQKLQEVTLPATTKVNTTKKKASEVNKDGKKDKDKVKKDKRRKKDKTPEPPVISESRDDEKMPATPPPPSLTGVSSITDVFANQFIEHAKKTLEIESTTSAKKEETKSGDGEDEFDIPTISQIAENAAVQRHRKELTELEEIQQKIYIAKQQLKMYSEESEEDDDYLNIKANDEDLDHIEESTKSAADRRKKSPITFKDREKVKEKEEEREKEKSTTPPITKKKSVLDRLGQRPSAVVASSVTGNQTKEKSNNNIISLSAHRRVEKEIYVPISRRKEYEREREKQSERERERMRRRERERDKKAPRRSKSRSRSRERNNHRRDRENNEKNDVRQRIGSRVIVIPNEEEKPEDKVEVPVNSVVKVKSRSKTATNRQPSKNLLLKAVAEAQKSLGQTPKPAATYKPSKKNLVIQISGEHSDEEYVTTNNNVETNDLSDEYIPEPLSQESDSEGVVYVPSKTNDELVIEEDVEELEIENESDTKFVVTLDGAFKTQSCATKSRSPGGTPPRLIQKPIKPSIKERIGYKKSEKAASPPPLSVTPTPVCENEEDQQEILKKRKERFSIRDINKAVKALSKSPSKNTEEKKKDEDSLMSTKEKNSPDHKKEKKSPDHKKEKKSPDRKKEKKSPDQKKEKRSPDQKKEHRDKEKDKEKKRNLNELLQKKTKELIDESVSSSPIYMSKSDYEKIDHSSRKRHRVSPIQFDLTDDETRNSDDDYHNDDHHHHSHHKRLKKDSLSSDKGHESDERDGKSAKKIKKLESSRKFDDVPALLSTVSLPSELPKSKTTIKERCKYFPNCRVGESCEYLHPATMCKAFPNCKFGDKCLYLHPRCKFDKTCTRLGCNYMHSVSLTTTALVAPPLASSVIPVQNYKSISASPLPAICKYFPSCSNTLCTFYHPKLCRFGKHCMNKVECNFYHHDLPSGSLNAKFKWVSPTA